MHEESGPSVFAYVAEYTTSEALVKAANTVYDAGYRQIDAYAPYPVHGLPEAIGFEDNRLKWMMFLGGLTGAFSGFGLQWWVCASAYAHNVGGRPYFSWPAFIPVTFECTVLFAALTGVFGMIGLNKLPQPYHPIFSAPRFERASQDAFFLTVEARDEMFDPVEVRKILEQTSPENISLINQEEEGDW